MAPVNATRTSPDRTLQFDNDPFPDDSAPVDPFPDTGDDATGPSLLLKEYDGCLILFKPREWATIKTERGSSEAIVTSIVVLDDAKHKPLATPIVGKTLVFAKVIQTRLDKYLGDQRAWPYVGRLGHGEAKSGQSAPWVLEPHTPADRPVIQAFLDSQKAR